MTWHCELCPDVIEGRPWTALDNHLRLMHPDVDRDARDQDGELVTTEAS